MSLLINETNNRYGKLKVITLTSSDRGGAKWLCQCDCGRFRIVYGKSLRLRTTISCGCLRRYALSKGQAGFNIVFHSMQRSGTSRKKEVALSKRYIKFLHQKPCFYCGVLPHTVQRVCHIDSHGTYIYNGIDRVDNTKGYIEGNVVTCCGACNYAKGSRSIVDFLAWIKQILKHNIRENCNGVSK